MATSAPLLSVNCSEFNDCVFVPIGDEENGMTLRVVSALARLRVRTTMAPGS